MGKEDCETSNEMMQAGYVPSGLLDTLVCKGKIDPRNGRTHWAVSQNHFHVFEQFIVTRNDRDAEFLDYFFLGEACDKGAPKRPDVGDEDCFWAMKIGSWFADGKVVNTVKAKDTQTESVRSCIQTVWGKPGYQMKCFMRGLDPDFDKIQKGPSPHGYEWLEDVTDSEAPIDELWATAHGSDYNVFFCILKSRPVKISWIINVNVSQCGNPQTRQAQKKSVRRQTQLFTAALRL